MVAVGLGQLLACDAGVSAKRQEMWYPCAEQLEESLWVVEAAVSERLAAVQAVPKRRRYAGGGIQRTREHAAGTVSRKCFAAPEGDGRAWTGRAR